MSLVLYVRAGNVTLGRPRTHTSRAWNTAEDVHARVPTTANVTRSHRWRQPGGARTSRRAGSKACAACGSRLPIENTVDASSCTPHTRMKGHLPWYFACVGKQGRGVVPRCCEAQLKLCDHARAMRAMIAAYRFKVHCSADVLGDPHAKVLTVFWARPTQQALYKRELGERTSNQSLKPEQVLAWEASE